MHLGNRKRTRRKAFWLVEKIQFLRFRFYTRDIFYFANQHEYQSRCRCCHCCLRLYQIYFTNHTIIMSLQQHTPLSKVIHIKGLLLSCPVSLACHRGHIWRIRTSLIMVDCRQYRLCHRASGTKYYEDVRMDFAVPLSVTGSDVTPTQFFMCCPLVNSAVQLLATPVRKNSTWTCFKVCRETLK